MMELLAPKDPQDKRKGFYVLLDQNAGGGPASGSISTTYTTLQPGTADYGSPKFGKARIYVDGGLPGCWTPERRGGAGLSCPWTRRTRVRPFLF